MQNFNPILTIAVQKGREVQQSGLLAIYRLGDEPGSMVFEEGEPEAGTGSFEAEFSCRFPRNPELGNIPASFRAKAADFIRTSKLRGVITLRAVDQDEALNYGGQEREESGHPWSEKGLEVPRR
jgi:hypothetical protein